MRVKILYDFYLDGYQNGICFGSVPEFNGTKSIQAYTKGYYDATHKQDKLDLYQFSKVVLWNNPKHTADIQISVREH